MNKGIEILLERIKTNPEEFMFDNEKPFAESRWRKIIANYKPYLNEEDVKALETEINKHLQESFTSAVMEELLDPKEEAQLTLNPYSTPTPLRTNTLSAGTTHTLSTASLQQQAAIQAQQAHIQLHQQVAQKQGLLGSIGNVLKGGGSWI